LQASGTATTALLLSGELFQTSSKSTSAMNNGFKLKVLATNWGFNGTVDEYCAKVKKAMTVLKYGGPVKRQGRMKCSAH
jgi:hypothetical protein